MAKHQFNEHQRYSIRKYAFGAASVLIGCAFMANSQVVHADQQTQALSGAARTVVENSGKLIVDKTVDNHSLDLSQLQAGGATWVDSNVTSNASKMQAASSEAETAAATPASVPDKVADATSQTEPSQKAATVVVTYPDGSTDEVNVSYTVAAETDADKNEPQVRTQTVKKGQTPSADSFITNKSDLPAGTTYSFKDKTAPAVVETDKPAANPVSTVTDKTEPVTPAPAIATKDNKEVAKSGVDTKEEAKDDKAATEVDQKADSQKVTVPELPASGRYTFTEKTEVHTTPRQASSVSFYYNKGDKVSYDKVLDEDNARWISYVSFSGIRRYAKIAELTKVAETTVDASPTENKKKDKALPTKGTYHFTKRTGIKNEPKMSSPTIYYYDAGEAVNYDKTLTADKHEWISYVSYNGTRRYIAVGEVAKEVRADDKSAPKVTAKPTVSKKTAQSSLATAGSYTFTKTAEVRNQAKMSSPVQFVFNKGDKVYYDKTLTADKHEWISYVSYNGARRYIAVAEVVKEVKVADKKTPKNNKVETPKAQTPAASNLPAKGTYTFASHASVKAQPSTKAPELAYYDKGDKVNYDKVVTADHQEWISYLSFTGNRRYIAIGNSKAESQKTVDKPATSPVKTETPKKVSLPASGRYTFTKTTEVRNQAKMSSPVQFVFNKGDKVYYDKTLTADKYEWISYVSRSGQRRYVALSESTVPVKETKTIADKTVKTTEKKADVETTVKPALPASGVYTFTKRAAVTNQPNTKAAELAFYDKGDRVNYDKIVTADNQNWLSYISYNGQRRYIQVG